ncbi:MAG: hypothetical protein M3R69_09755, partial [Acidobacteriota bacterium]|nr:hypothetical protein [Acidobacteriota bacterium]
ARHTRLSARDVLTQWESGRPFDVPPNELVRRSLAEEEERHLDGPERSTLLIRRRGLKLLRGETTIARWNGLVDVANAPAIWVEPLRIGPLAITSSGIARHDESNDPHSVPQ